MQLLYVKHKVLVVVFKKKHREPKRSVTNINFKKKRYGISNIRIYARILFYLGI